MDTKKILLFFVMLLIIPIASATMEWDNDLDYKNDDMTVEITNWLGFGEKIGEATLVSHKAITEVRNVMPGEDRVVMYYDFNFSEDYVNGLGEVYLTDMNTGEEIEKEYHFVYETIKEYVINVPNPINCRMEGNIEVCDYGKSTPEIRTKAVWKPFTGQEIPGGEIRIGLATDVWEGDHTDAVWTIAGKKVSRHASWTSALNVNIFTYYKFEDNNESVTGAFNLSDDDGTPSFNATGIIFSAGNITDNNNFQIDDDDTVMSFDEDNKAMNFWANPTTTASGDALIRKTNEGVFTAGWGIHQLADGALRFGIEWGNTDFTDILYDGEWTMITIVRNTTETCLWVNASLQGCMGGQVATAGTSPVRIGDGTWSGTDYDGRFDEASWWNRTLTNAEITQLWNNGSGITFTTEFGAEGISLNITKELPVNGTSTTNNAPNFTVFLAGNNANITNATLHIWELGGANEQTDFDELADNATVNNTWTAPFTLVDGTYEWNVFACGLNSTASSCAFNNSNFTLEIDLEPPAITIDSPFDNYTFLLRNGTLDLNLTIEDSAGLDTCYYIYNGTQVNLNCADLNTSFGYTVGNNSISVFANDTLGNSNTTNKSWIVYVIDNERTFINETTEGNILSFTQNVTIGEGLTLSEAFLIYNDSSYIGTRFLIDDNYISTRDNFIAFGVSTETQFEFYWSLLLSNGLTVNLTAYNQTVFPLGVDNCSVFPTILFNFTIVDEKSQLFLSNNTEIETAINVYSADRSLLVLNFSVTTLSNPYSVCLSRNLSNETTYVLDTIIKYESDVSAIEYYNIVNATLNETTVFRDIILYDLNLTDSTEFKLTFTGANFLPVENALVYLYRQYIAEDVFKVVELPKTDSNGQTILHLVRNDVIYNVIIIKNGVVLGNFENLVAFCDDATIGDCKLDLNAFESTEEVFDYNEDLGIIFSAPEYNETTGRMTFTYLTADGTIKNVSMILTRENIFGNATLCTNSLLSSGGTLICDIDPTIPESIIRTTVYVEDVLTVIDLIQTDSSNYGGLGYLAFFVMAMSFILMFSDTKTGVLIGMFISFAGAVGLGFISSSVIGLGASGLWLMIAILIGIWKLNKGRPQ